MQVVANVDEADIGNVKEGQRVTFTVDAFPNDQFSGKVTQVRLKSTVTSNVVTYQVVVNTPNKDLKLKPGMTANMTILVAKKDNALAVPSSAVINESNGNYVRVIDDPKKLTYHQVEVQTGLQADGGLVEITSGLNDGQEIVTYVKP